MWPWQRNQGMVAQFGGTNTGEGQKEQEKKPIIESGRGG